MEEYFMEKLAKIIPEHAKVLDFGSGAGIPYDKYLVNQGFDVTGIDITQNNAISNSNIEITKTDQ